MSDFQRPSTAQEAVLVEVRSRILRGELAPGAPLRQEELAADLGVSRVPLREALRMLESEGHVSYAPHRGYRVVELHIDDLEEIYHLRALIEDDLAIRAMANQGPEDLADVRRAHEALAVVEAEQPSDPARLAAANRAFHWAILRPPPRAERILATLWDASEAHRARWFADPANVSRGAQEHAAVLAAVLAGDGAAVVSHLAEHRAGAIEVLRVALD